MAIGVFAGIPVRDYNSAAQWYQQLFGSEPAFYPNDVEAVWMMAEDRYVYIVEAPDRAGGAANMVWTDNLAKEIERIASADWRRQTSRSTVTCESMSTATPTATRPGLAATG